MKKQGKELTVLTPADETNIDCLINKFLLITQNDNNILYIPECLISISRSKISSDCQLGYSS